MKRITHYPQFVLGFPFAWAIFMSCAALNVDPTSSRHIISAMSLFIANVLWTMKYDTVSTHQDIRDDIKAGVKTMAVRFSDSAKKLAAILATVQVALLLHADRAGTAFALGIMIAEVDLKEPSSCALFFHVGSGRLEEV